MYEEGGLSYLIGSLWDVCVCVCARTLLLWVCVCARVRMLCCFLLVISVLPNHSMAYRIQLI